MRGDHDRAVAAGVSALHHPDRVDDRHLRPRIDRLRQARANRVTEGRGPDQLQPSAGIHQPGPRDPSDLPDHHGQGWRPHLPDQGRRQQGPRRLALPAPAAHPGRGQVSHPRGRLPVPDPQHPRVPPRRGRRARAAPRPVYELRKLWREGGAEVQRQKLAAAGWRQLADSGSGAVLAPIDTPAAHRYFAVLDLRLPARPQTPSIPEAPPRRRVRLRVGTTLRINRLGTERLLGSGGDRRQSSDDADRTRLGVDARPLRIRRLSREIRALERIQATQDVERAAAGGPERRSWTPA